MDGFYRLVARELELLPAGQEIEDDVREVIAAVYEARWGTLVSKRLGYFPKADIPDEALGPLAVWIASYAAFQLLDADGAAMKRAARADAENDLRILSGDKRQDTQHFTRRRTF